MAADFVSVSCYITRMAEGYVEVVTEAGETETYYITSQNWRSFEAWAEARAGEWMLIDVDRNGFIVGWQ